MLEKWKFHTNGKLSPPPPEGVFRNLSMSSGMHFLDPTHLGLRLSTLGSKSLKTYIALGLGAEAGEPPP